MLITEIYWLFPDSCYKPTKGDFTWNEARAECARVNSQVAYPVDEDELFFMYNEGCARGFWVGAYDFSLRNVWITVDGRSYDG